VAHKGGVRRIAKNPVYLFRTLYRELETTLAKPEGHETVVTFGDIDHAVLAANPALTRAHIRRRMADIDIEIANLHVEKANLRDELATTRKTK